MLVLLLNGAYAKPAERLNMQTIIRSVLLGHRNIIAGIEQGNPEQAIAYMREHLAGTIERVMTLKDEYPDYFC